MNAARRLAAIVVLGVLAATADAAALPAVGSTRPDIRLVDAWERTFDLSQVGPRALLVVYEDKSAAQQNAPLKEELSRLARGTGTGPASRSPPSRTSRDTTTGPCAAS